MTIFNKNVRNERGGFTLIELLVVIAIIGVLSAVVLASLNSARNKGADAAIKSNINNARAQAELFYDNANSYTDVCTDTDGISKMKTGAQNALGSTGTVTCNDDADAWAMSSPLKSTPTLFYCVDSTGNGTTTATTLTGEVCQ
jgi:prepilin-type N-terminal cleavage/methylation domain-containing protein